MSCDLSSALRAEKVLTSRVAAPQQPRHCPKAAPESTIWNLLPGQSSAAAVLGTSTNDPCPTDSQRDEAGMHNHPSLPFTSILLFVPQPQCCPIGGWRGRWTAHEGTGGKRGILKIRKGGAGGVGGDR